MDLFWTVLRVAYGLLFVYAGAEKIADPVTFAGVIHNYQIVPVKLVYAVALGLPALEVVCGLALCAGTLARGAVVVLNALMAVFIAVMGIALLRGLDVTCGCFGGAGDAVTRLTLQRDLGMLALGLAAMWGIFAQKRRELALRPRPAPRPEPIKKPASEPGMKPGDKPEVKAEPGKEPMAHAGAGAGADPAGAGQERTSRLERKLAEQRRAESGHDAAPQGDAVAQPIPMPASGEAGAPEAAASTPEEAKPDAPKPEPEKKPGA